MQAGAMNVSCLHKQRLFYLASQHRSSQGCPVPVDTCFESDEAVMLVDKNKENLYNGNGKGKGHPCTGTEALYRQYGP
jgi:hypothetical protein